MVSAIHSGLSPGFISPFILVPGMKFLIQILLLLWLAAGCSTKAEKTEPEPLATGTSNVTSAQHTYNGLLVEITNIKECGYPANDLLFEKKKNKKLVVLQVAVTNSGNCQKEDIIPMGASIEDEKGNVYDTSPGVVAMAQSSGCIKGDDLKSYNSIWSGEIKRGETHSAFAVGFEVPASAVLERFYWNTNWNNAGHPIFLRPTNETVNH